MLRGVRMKIGMLKIDEEDEPDVRRIRSKEIDKILWELGWEIRGNGKLAGNKTSKREGGAGAVATQREQ